MIISEILAARQYDPLQQQRRIADSNNVSSETGVLGNAKAGEDGRDFASTLREFIGDVNGAQIESADANEKLIKGEPVDIHDVMISAEKAKTSFQLLLELRNKALDLYRETIRIQI